jgi:hypothetical protein
MKCPRCGEEMSSGYMGLGSISPHGLLTSLMVKWENQFEEQGESLLSKTTNGPAQVVKIDAYRCAGCKLVVFSYEESAVDAYKDRHEYREKPRTEDFADVEKYLR